MAVVIEEMTTAYVPIGNDTDDVIVEADSFERDFEYEDYDEGEPIKFDGYTGSGQVRDASGTLISTLVIGTLDSTGVVNVTLATLPAPGTYSYDIEIVKGPIKKTIQRGPFHVTAQVTQ
jgi:hypothetical protein